MPAGHELHCLQGPATDKDILARLTQAVHMREALEVGKLVSYDKLRRPFSHSVSVCPIQSPCGKLECFSIVSRAVTRLDVPSKACHSLDLLDRLDCFEIEGHEGMGSGGLTPLALSCPRPLPALVPPSTSPFVVLMRGESPFDVLWASEGWLELCGFHASEVVGGDLKLIQGPGTDRMAICRMMAAVKQRQPVTVPNLVNYDKFRRPFRHTVHSVYVPPGTEGNPEGMFRATSTGVARSVKGIFDERLPVQRHATAELAKQLSGARLQSGSEGWAPSPRASLDHLNPGCLTLAEIDDPSTEYLIRSGSGLGIDNLLGSGESSNDSSSTCAWKKFWGDNDSPTKDLQAICAGSGAGGK